ncbi:hypothetical protein AMC90_CH04053 [Rhizobium phaseoli]|uniref:Transmembrane protein n=2 Tax=Rhizobium TaxID=379 RepID=B3PQ30_RHIE6|nr:MULTISPECIES: hypothetical protein [Rhizobium]ACE93042.1 hypothetical protein RHECIAT_CH0004113 [Rhizobium etli CIAT 652]MDH6650175.1 hypothetical protein [Rhizobium esperanzae]ANL29802.1 hypothetical protein AMC90_CH04053 [Rhizobium phaseoli]ANL55100.1 hypothetical protein AMC86_CH04020 [Rhizobium phaseoli]ANL86711.1 hypothetical protein AMC81_CH03998 [Rhizobium phaseoli]
MAHEPHCFFSCVPRAPFGGSLWQSQVDGLNKILDEWERRGLSDVRWLAYMLATTFHETGGKMQPVREAGGEKYTPALEDWKRIKMIGYGVSGLIAIAGLTTGAIVTWASDGAVAWIRHWLKIN